MMSARGGRNRFFIGIICLLLMLGFITIFRQSQQELNESKELRSRCEQQQEVLNSRLQAIIEHKFKIEKSLETERREHLETKQKCENTAKEQKNIHNHAQSELNTRFESLQQHYKLLQSEHNDLIEDCMKTKQLQLEEINGIKGKIKSLQLQIQQTKNQHEKDIEEWKLKFEGLTQEKKHLENLLNASKSSNDVILRNSQNLEKLINDCKSHCEYQSQQQAYQHENQQMKNDLSSNTKDDKIGEGGGGGGGDNGIGNNGNGQQHEVHNQVKGNILQIEKNFNEQLPINENLYKIAIKITNKTNNNNNNNNMLHDITNNNGVGLSSLLNENPNKNNQPIKMNGGIINSVENFQIAPNLLMNADETSNNNHNTGGGNNNGNSNNNDNKQVLQQPPPLNSPIKSSTVASNPLKTSSNKPDSFNVAGISIVHSSTSEKIKQRSSSTIANDRIKESGGRLLLKSKPIPNGVAPIPDNFDTLVKNDENNQSENNKQNINNNNNNNNNRYANVVNEFSDKKNDQDDPEQDNGAQEIKDDINIGDEKNNLNLNDDGKDHLQDILDNVNNNAAEDDTNNFIDSKNIIGKSKNNNLIHKDNEDVEGIDEGRQGAGGGGGGEREGGIGGGGENKQDKGDNLIEGNDKLINEVVGDQGKEAAFPDGMHLEEANEDDEDEDDYLNPAARQQEGHAVRN